MEFARRFPGSAQRWQQDAAQHRYHPHADDQFNDGKGTLRGEGIARAAARRLMEQRIWETCLLGHHVVRRWLGGHAQQQPSLVCHHLSETQSKSERILAE